MISLLNVLKAGVLIYTDDVYTISVNEPEPVIIPEPEADMQMQDIGGPIDEEAVWERLKARLEVERKAVLKEAHDEAGFIRNQAYHEGYSKGLSDKAGEIDSLISRSDLLIREMNDKVCRKLQEYEEGLQVLASEIASKVLARKIEQDDRIITDLIRKVIDEVRSSEWIKVTLSDELRNVLGELEGELRQGRLADKFELAVKEAPKGTCIVETPNGVIDASIHTQLDNLKSYFIN